MTDRTTRRWVFVLRLVAAIVASAAAMSCASGRPPADFSPKVAIEPTGPVVSLEMQGNYEAGYVVRHKPEQRERLGWTGEDPVSRFSLRGGMMHRGRPALFMHPPYRVGSGYGFQQFRVALPGGRMIHLVGGTAMQDEVTGKSDGVVFRVRVGDEVVWAHAAKGPAWTDFDIDLSRFAGRTVVLRFETDCGPANNTAYDWSLWGGRVLKIAGYEPAPMKAGVPPEADLSKLVSKENGDVVPLSAEAGERRCWIDEPSGDAALEYEGDDGKLTYWWSPPVKADDPALGRWILRAKARGVSAVEVPLATGNGVVWTDKAEAEGPGKLERDGAAIRCTRVYRVENERAMLTLVARVVNKSLVIEATCDKPVVSSIEGGAWGPVPIERRVSVPYLSEPVEYLGKEGLFASRAMDWLSSHASALTTDRGAVYEPLTDHTRNRLHERLIYTAAWRFDEVLPNIPNPPSPWRKDLSGRIVLDLWYGNFGQVTGWLKEMASYGLRDNAVVVHNWQHHGYDLSLPDSFPANPKMGGGEAMKQLVATGKSLGWRVALHENYVDYYPQYVHYDPKQIARGSDGQFIKAWYRKEFKIQSYAVANSAQLDLAKQWSSRIHGAYGTNAMFLDVSSAVPPWFHVDQRAGVPEAGEFRQTWDAHRKLWAYERQAHGGPVLGEGNNHAYWSGYLDGVEAQFGEGWPENRGTSAPLMVDFDLLRIHPLQLNHGMGYLGRWAEKLGPGGRPNAEQLDQYRMQEVAYGHAGFVYRADVPLMWMEQNLTRPVTRRTATANPVKIAYEVGGKWTDTSGAARADDFNRLRVTWSGGVVVTANNSAELWQVDGLTLPRFGWSVKGPGLRAYTAVRDGRTVDFAQTDDAVFANVRSGSVADFGTLRTDGSVSLQRDGHGWSMYVLHRDAPMRVEFDAAAWPMPATITCEGGKTATVTPRRDGRWWTMELNGASRYRW